MFKKNSTSWYILALIFVLASCKKEMSPDEPLPSVRKQTVFITTNNSRLYGYDAVTGKKTWEKSLNAQMVGSPCIADSAIYLMTQSGTLYAWNLFTQEKHFANKSYISISPNNSIAGTNTAIFVPSDKLYKLKTNGDEEWNYNSNNGPATTAVTVNEEDQVVYVGFTNEIHCVDFSGKLIWKSSNSPLITTTIKERDGGLFYGSSDNRMYCEEKSNGSLRWTYTTNSLVLSSPLVYGGMSISGSDDNTIYCVDMKAGIGKQGLLRWKVPTGERVQSSAAIHVGSNTVLIGCHDFYLYAIDHVSGQLKWKYPAGSIIASSPVVLGNNAYFASHDKYMYCINILTGKLVWKTNMDFSADGSPIIDNVSSEAYSGLSGMSGY